MTTTTHTFRGHKYRLVEAYGSQDVLGTCDAPHIKGKAIVAPVNNGEKLSDLDTVIHEALHACFWDLSEDAVDTGATCIAKLLWRAGWRKQ